MAEGGPAPLRQLRHLCLRMDHSWWVVRLLRTRVHTRSRWHLRLKLQESTHVMCWRALRCLNWCARWKLSSVPFLIFEVQVGWPFCCLIPVGEKASELVQVPSIPRAITPRPLRRVPPAKLWPPKHSNAWQERDPCRGMMHKLDINTESLDMQHSQA